MPFFFGILAGIADAICFQGHNSVLSVAFSPDMLKLARGEGNEAVVCCAVSGLEFLRLVGHR